MDMFTKILLAAFIHLLFLTQVPITCADYLEENLDLEKAVRIAEEDLHNRRSILSRMNQGLAQQEQNLAESQEEEQTLLTKLAEIDQRIFDDSEQLVAMYKEMQLQQLKTRETKAALESTDSEKKILAIQTEKRLAAYYRMGDIGVLNITFSTSTLPELVNFHEYYRYMLRQDRQLIHSFRVKLTELKQAREAHTEEAKRLELAMEDTKKQQVILAATKQDQQKVIAQIQVEKSLYQEAAQQLEQSAQTLIQEIEDLEDNARQAKQVKEEWMIATYPIEPHKKRKPSWLRGIGGHKKQLTPPIIGTVTKLYTGDSGLPGDLNFGVDFKIAPQAKIRAVFTGKVVHAGFVQGYGQLVIISHSDDYYTLTSSINTITVQKGDMVKQGDELGYTSKHGANMQEDLHFEIRLKEKPLDPLDWLDENYIIFSPELEATL
jgi:septal ring factor EnvC (AmiA/AmiB activator)